MIDVLIVLIVTLHYTQSIILSSFSNVVRTFLFIHYYKRINFWFFNKIKMPSTAKKIKYKTKYFTELKKQFLFVSKCSSYINDYEHKFLLKMQKQLICESLFQKFREFFHSRKFLPLKYIICQFIFLERCL